MVLIIICAIAGAILGVRVRREGNYGGKVEAVMILAVAGMMVGLILAGIATMAAYVILPFEDVETSRQELVAFRDSSGIRGSFFLGCGSIENEFYYSFYYKTSDGGAKFNQVSVGKTTLYEEDRTDGYILTKEKRMGKNLAWFDHLFLLRRPSYYREVHIPKGSIVRDYKLDLN